ncbi:hypothetical protein NLC28_01090, partial [Candidatus Aminicenantes bacterium AC-335-O07]|nr:hypothetical protein [Candidatus Aminicenantes bacterium AC-335-O07]
MRRKISRKFLILVLFSIIFTISSCVSTTHTRIRPGTNLNRFGYVYIALPVYPDGTIDKYGIGSKLAMMFSSLGLQVLSETEAKNFPKSKLSQILYCRIQHFHSPVAGGLGGSY